MPFQKQLQTSTVILWMAALVMGGCAAPRASMVGPSPATSAPGTVLPSLTPADAEAFVDSADVVLYDLGVRAARAAWVQATYITEDTELLAAQANEKLVAAATALGTRAAEYLKLRNLPFDVQRRLELLRSGLSMPAPPDAARTAELARIAAGMESRYGSGTYCPEPGRCMSIGELSGILANSRNPDSLLMAWKGWRTISPPMRDNYERFVELTNEGALSLGFEDLGAMWRSNYDMDPGAFAETMDSLWMQVRPLYESLHCYVRTKLTEQYGPEVMPPGAPIPAHLLGNMWAQEWGNIFDVVAPKSADPGYDVAELLRERDIEPVEMVRYGERFFTSIGLDPLPDTFWKRSLFTKPADRDVVCHASAWDVDEQDDLRIKMCIEQTADDFQTIHHELGHNFYQRAYNDLPYIYRGSANDGFHEALGDAVALSMTPDYYRQIGFIKEVPPESQDIGLLLRSAMDKVAFLPFGLLVDKWRWGVFSGDIAPSEYNEAWWALRHEYQGIEPPVTRTEADFDPGAKYHVPANTPYARYFLARILQFQFHKALCAAAGYEGPLNRCSIYGSKAAGERLNAMMALGRSRPWPEALEQLTGSPRMTADALLDYYAPLKTWLDEQNQGATCGWK